MYIYMLHELIVRYMLPRSAAYDMQISASQFLCMYI